RTYHDAIPRREIVDSGARLDDGSTELVPEDVATLHPGQMASVSMQIRAADTRGRDAHDGVARIADGRIGDVLDPDLVGTVPAHGSHEAPSVAERTSASSVRCRRS